MPPRLGLTPKQLELRRTVLGGTDAAAVFGLSTYRNAFDVYAEKVGEVRPRGEMSEDALWGLLLEPVIVEEYQRRTGVSIRRPKRLSRNKERPWQAGHLDGMGKDRILEVKVRSWPEGWGEPGSDEVPPAVRMQAEHYLAVTGAPRADIAVLLRGARMEVYTVWRKERLTRDLTAEEQEWWEQHVVARVPPEWDGSPGATAYLRRKHPRHVDRELVALPHQYGILEDYKAARHKAALWEQQEERLKQAIMDAMGDAQKLLAPGLAITWSRSRDYEQVDWQVYAGELERVVEELALGTFPVNMDPLETKAALRSLHTQTRPGVRKFRVRETQPQLQGERA